MRAPGRHMPGVRKQHNHEYMRLTGGLHSLLALGVVTGGPVPRPLRPGPPLGAPFWGEQGGDDSFRSFQGRLWTDLDEYASDAHCMHATCAVLSKKQTCQDLFWHVLSTP